MFYQIETISKRDRNYKNHQIEILELKSTITKIKKFSRENSMSDLNRQKNESVTW